MNETLKDLYFERMSKSRAHITPEENDIHKKIQTERRYFSEVLSESDKQRLNELEALHGQLHSFEDMYTFKCAFRMGVMMMCDVFMGEETEE